MDQVRIHRTSVKSAIVICILLLMQTSLAWTAEEITGDWKITMDFDGRQNFATLSISKKPDGTLTGKWGSSELSDVKFENNKLTFVRKMSFGDQEFTMDYSGTLKDGKLTGTLSSDMGDIPANGVRKVPKSPVLGQWDVHFNVMDQDINARLIISQTKDGKLEGKWTEEMGEQEMGEHKISNLKFEEGKLSFTRDSKIEDFEFESTFEGTIKGNELTGTMKSQMGDIPVTGKRFGTALIGTWELTTTSDFGTRTSMMVVDPDMTGTYEFFGGEIPMKDLKLEGDQVTFKLEMGFGDQTFGMDFKGKIDGKTLKGQLDSERGASDVVGKKIEKPAPKASAAALVGKWELTTVSDRGERTRTLTIKDDMTGTYQMRNEDVPIKDLKVEGDQVTFKIVMSFADNQFEMNFKGKLQDGTLVGEFTTDRGSMKATGKKM